MVGKFVEFFGAGRASLAVPDRATIANMAPEYGATMGFFPVDEKTVDYFSGTGRTDDEIEALRGLLQGAGPVRHAGARARSTTPRSSSSTSAPWRRAWPAPSARRTASSSATSRPVRRAVQQAAGGERLQPAGRQAAARTRCTAAAAKAEPSHGHRTRAPAPVVEMEANKPDARSARQRRQRRHAQRHDHRQRRRADRRHHLLHQHLQPERAAGRRPAGEEGGGGGAHGQAAVKTSLAPGSRIVTEYLEKAGLLPYLEKLGFYVAAYGCTTCIGNAGDLAPEINEVITRTIWCAPRCCRATATSRRASTRT